MGKKELKTEDTFDKFDIEDIESSYTDTDLFNPEEIINTLETKPAKDKEKHLSALRKIEDMMDDRRLEDSLRDLFDDDPNSLLPE